jgi:hypothetical protein
MTYIIRQNAMERVSWLIAESLFTESDLPAPVMPPPTVEGLHVGPHDAGGAPVTFIYFTDDHT